VARPDAIALVGPNCELTYGETMRQARRIASSLVRLGAGPEAIVALCVDRGVDAIVGLLGILQSGAAYLPLDPRDPTPRLAALIADAGVDLVVASRTDRGRFREPQVRQVSLEDALADGSPTDALPTMYPRHDRLAYVMYTSGSTGKPKGVAVTHRSIVRLVHGSQYVRFGSDRVVLQLAPLNFDASTFEIWAPLTNGGECVVAPGGVPDFEELGRLLVAHGVTTAWLTASLFNAIIDEAPNVLLPLDELIVGGEPLSATHVRRAMDVLPGTRIVNGYGPTEGTTFTTCYAVPPAFSGTAPVPIGTPIGNTHVYVVDECWRLIDAGGIGELFIGGDGVARGYHRQPAATADRFVPDPFSGVPGARLYRTGDRVVLRADGVLGYLGRTDGQVKVRGHRVEPAEVEAVVNDAGGVLLSAVCVLDDGLGGSLIAYVVPDGDRPELVASLRAHLTSTLPDYMVPTRIVVVERLPLTANGKLDRARLSALAPDEHAVS